MGKSSTASSSEKVDLCRRRFLAGSSLIAAGMIAPAVFASTAQSAERSLAFHHLHTGEDLRVTYWAEGDYLTESLAEINHLLRDHRTDEVHSIDPGLLDLLQGIQTRLGSSREFQIISGYRSPKTNNMLRTNSSGVAKRSLHMQGKAIDIRLPGCSLKQLRKVAVSQKAGGVGIYAKSGFIHVDTGRVRYW